MPPRLFTLVIVAFWLVMVALFNVTDVWPRLSPAEPLMFPVDVVDEAGQGKELVNYDVSKNGTPKYRAEVEWQYHPEDDSFESECQLEKRWDDPEVPRDQGAAWLPQVHQVKMTSTYRLTRNGKMKALDVKTEYQLARGEDDEGGVKVKAEVRGSPRAGHFAPHVKLTFPGLSQDEKIGPFTAHDFERDGEPVPVLGRGTVLNPLHPPRRFADLVEGQRWRFTFIDPLALLGLVAPLDAANGGALRQAGVGGGASVLEARVLPGLQVLKWDDGKDVPYRVVECEGDGPVGPLTLWVRAPDGVVMREDFRLWGDSWSLVRLSLGHKMRFSPIPRKVP